jgi:hypothetical protein
MRSEAGPAEYSSRPICLRAWTGPERGEHWQILPKSLTFGDHQIRPMPTRNISLTPEQDAYLDDLVAPTRR